MRKIELLHDVLIKVPEVVKKESNGLLNIIAVDEVANTIRFGEVLDTPFKCVLQKGDIIYFHHNIVARRKSMDGSGVFTGSYEIDRSEGLYHCPLTEIFGYERDGIFKALDPFCFVKPIKNINNKEDNGLIVVDKNKEIPYIGILKHSNEKLRAMGLNDGAKVVFGEWSMYEYPIKGEKLYRMRDKKIIGTWDE